MPEPSTYKLAKVFDGSKRYIVPTYQRGYAWTSDEIDDFLSDLKSANDSADEHFFGFVLTTSNPDPNDPCTLIKIIDGQQRLSTVMLYLACARNYFKSKNTQKAKKYYAKLEDIIRSSKYKTTPSFTLSRTNQDLFQEILIKDDSVNRNILNALSATSDSNEKLAAAYKQIGADIEGEKIDLIHDYLNTLLKKFTIIIYDYHDEGKAYNMFNLINNRGVRLNESDHIKNYLFGELEKSRRDVVDKHDVIWTAMRDIVTSRKHANYKNLDLFLLHYLLATNASSKSCLTLKDLYRTFYDLIDNHKKSPGEIISELYDLSQILKTLRAPTLAHFDQNKTTVYYLRTIKKIQAVYVYPLLLAAYKNYWERGNKILFELVVILCFKYHMRAKVIGKITTASFEAQLRKLTQSVIDGSSARELSRSIAKLMEEAYPSTDEVFNTLESKHVSKPSIVVALLHEIEYTRTKKRSLDVATIEHIMPKKFNAWRDYIVTHNKKYIDAKKTREQNIRSIHARNVNYLGNQTLLSSKNNKVARNSTFKKKKEDYKEHPKYEITADLTNNVIWNVSAILKRNRNLSEILCSELDLGRITKYLDQKYQNGVAPDKVL